MDLHTTSKNDRTLTPKVWGSEEEIVNNEKYCGKLLSVNKGWQSSLHYHPVKHETFLCLVGCVWLEYIPDSTTASPYGTTTERMLLRGWARDAVEIPSNTPHRFYADIEDALVVEFSTTHSDEDVVRLQESGPVEVKKGV